MKKFFSRGINGSPSSGNNKNDESNSNSNEQRGRRSKRSSTTNSNNNNNNNESESNSRNSSVAAPSNNGVGASNPVRIQTLPQSSSQHQRDEDEDKTPRPGNYMNSSTKGGKGGGTKNRSNSQVQRDKHFDYNAEDDEDYNENIDDEDEGEHYVDANTAIPLTNDDDDDDDDDESYEYGNNDSRKSNRLEKGKTPAPIISSSSSSATRVAVHHPYGGGNTRASANSYSANNNNNYYRNSRINNNLNSGGTGSVIYEPDDEIREAVRRALEAERRNGSANELLGEDAVVAFNNDEDDEDAEVASILNREMTIKDRQETLNRSHLFGIRLWKPALYKKTRGIDRETDQALHSDPMPLSSSSPIHNDPHFERPASSTHLHQQSITPGSGWSLMLYPGNILWLLLFGWWMALVYVVTGIVLLLLILPARPYAFLMFNLAGYILWPFGKYVEKVAVQRKLSGSSGSNTNTRNNHNNPSEESLITGKDLEQGVSALDNHNRMGIRSSGLFTNTSNSTSTSEPLIEGPGDILYYLVLFFTVGPMHLIVSAICWFLVISVPMAKLNFVLLQHLVKSPKGIWARTGRDYSYHLIEGDILLCTYRAVGLQYYKYTYDGVNIILLNLVVFVVFALVDGKFLAPLLNHQGLGHPLAVFIFCVLSIIPLAYYIGMAVSSISAQSSLGMAAVINATFGSIVEIILYALAISQGKSDLVEGAIIGSFLGAMLLLPGVSMIAGGIKRKQQRFNTKSAGVTSTLLIISMIGTFTPTVFYSIYGTFDLSCSTCTNIPSSTSSTMFLDSNIISNNSINNNTMMNCHACTMINPNIYNDPIFNSNVRPISLMCAAVLPAVYLVGLWFTLRTHVSHIYESPASGHAHGNIGTAINTLVHNTNTARRKNQGQGQNIGSVTTGSGAAAHFASISRQSVNNTTINLSINNNNNNNNSNNVNHLGDQNNEDDSHGGHNAPNWSKLKSSIILLASTVLFSLLAEVLLECVDDVLASFTATSPSSSFTSSSSTSSQSSSNVHERFLGLTLFALAPNFTEFLNAIAFAMYGNIELSLEIGSAYTLQVALLQVPALIFFSTLYNSGGVIDPHKAFELLFPKWDMIATLFSCVILTYSYNEGKANYFKGAVLSFVYIILITTFAFVPAT